MTTPQRARDLAATLSIRAEASANAIMADRYREVAGILREFADIKDRVAHIKTEFARHTDALVPAAWCLYSDVLAAVEGP